MTLPPAPPHGVPSLVHDLARLGVARGDLVMVHASLRRIDAAPPRAQAVLDALDLALGPEGTLVMVLGAVVPHEWVNARPEAERPRLLAELPPSDPLTAPALPEVGHLAEAFRTRPGARVTQSPSGRFGARGRLVDALFEHDPWHDYYGPGSVLERLCQLGGKVLRLGASPDTTTALHYAEYLAPLPKKRRVVRHYRVMGPDGPETRSLSCLDDEHGIVDYPPPGSPPVSYPEDDYFAVLLGDYLARGEGARGVVGSAESCLLSAAELVAFGAEWMGRRLAGCPTTDQGASGEEHEDAGHDDHDDHDDHDGHDEGRGGRRP